MAVAGLRPDGAAAPGSGYKETPGENAPAIQSRRKEKPIDE
jgi:hypothetical protein